MGKSDTNVTFRAEYLTVTFLSILSSEESLHSPLPLPKEVSPTVLVKSYNIAWEDRTSVEELPQLDWPVASSVKIVLIGDWR